MTSKEALRRVVSEIDKYKLYGIGDENWLGIQDVLKDISTIENALKQAQKQDKLLKLYKEYYELDRMYVKNNFFLELENLNRRSEIVEQIKELENE